MLTRSKLSSSSVSTTGSSGGDLKSRASSAPESSDVYSVPTAQSIADFDYERRERREKLTLFRRPLQTSCVFFSGFCLLMTNAIKYAILNPVTLYLLLPLFLVWYLLEYIPGPYTATINAFEFWLEYAVWWVGLGILSSIGLGSGLQSGLLFLYPHVIKTCLAAQTCKSLDFDSWTDIWFRTPKSLFKCPPGAAAASPVTFLGMWSTIILPCFLQAAGTAIGEIPPYWMTRASRLAAIASGDDQGDAEEIPEELEANSKYSYVNRLKIWMVRFLRQNGFYGVLLMASYPNMAFDLCGICCGHFLMPFWTFLSATFIGKAVIRNGYQSVVYIALCSEKYLEYLIRSLQYLAPDSWRIDQMIRDVLVESRESFKKLEDSADSPAKPMSSLASSFVFYWQLLMTIMLATFLLSCISQFAQHHQLQIDMVESEKLRRRLPPGVLQSITSPMSGRLRLPKPSRKSGGCASNAGSPEASSDRPQPPSSTPSPVKKGGGKKR